MCLPCPFTEDCAGVVELIPMLDLDYKVNADGDPITVIITKTAVGRCTVCQRYEVDHFDQANFTMAEFMNAPPLKEAFAVKRHHRSAFDDETIFTLTCGNCGETFDCPESQLRDFQDAYSESTPCCDEFGWFVENDFVIRTNGRETETANEPSPEFLAEVDELNAFALGVTNAAGQGLEQADLPF